MPLLRTYLKQFNTAGNPLSYFLQNLSLSSKIPMVLLRLSKTFIMAKKDKQKKQ